MISRLEKINSSFANPINQPMFLGDSSRPAACQYVFKRLWFPNTGEGISQNRCDQLEHAQSYLAVCSYPIAQVLPKLRMEYCVPLNDSCQHPSPGEASPGVLACLCGRQ